MRSERDLPAPEIEATNLESAEPMTGLSFAHDSSAYSTRSCRCGGRMLISSPSGRVKARWRCPGCGRSSRR